MIPIPFVDIEKPIIDVDDSKVWEIVEKKESEKGLRELFHVYRIEHLKSKGIIR